jgi:hypothetical protein
MGVALTRAIVLWPQIAVLACARQQLRIQQYQPRGLGAGKRKRLFRHVIDAVSYTRITGACARKILFAVLHLHPAKAFARKQRALALGIHADLGEGSCRGTTVSLRLLRSPKNVLFDDRA